MKLHRSRRKLSFECLEARVVFDAGDVDTDFGVDGFAFLDFAERLDFAHAVAIQSDGIIVAGQAGSLQDIEPRTDLAVVRFTNEGTLDPNFGNGGIFLGEFAEAHANAHGLAIQLDDKIVVAGDLQPSGGFVVLRLDSNGSFDPGFNGSGIFATDLSARANDVLIQPDEKIVVVGDAVGPLGFQIFLARFHDDGSLDTSFDEDGVLFTPILLANGSAQAVALQNDGKIVVTGYGTADDTNLSSIFVARYEGDGGSLDSSFGGDGLIHTTISTDSKASDVAVDENNRIVVVGNDNGSFVLVRYTEGGTLDDAFNGGGVVTMDDLNPVPGGTTGAGVLIQQDGKIVASASGGNDFVVLRFDANGNPDTTFNGVGKVVTGTLSSDSSEAVALQQDGKIVVAGTSGGDWAVVRYLVDETDSLSWQNPNDRFDVTGDFQVVPLDVLRVINELNERNFAAADGSLPSERPDDAPFLDVDGNNFVTPLDALGIINFLNNAEDEGEGELVADAVLDLIGFDITCLRNPTLRNSMQMRSSAAEQRRHIARHFNAGTFS
jgi:uncharacterized delta-60 repeat protein